MIFLEYDTVFVALSESGYYILVALQAICMVVIVFTNVVVIAATVLVRKLHTPDNYIIAGLAVSDLFVGLWCVPLYILEDLPETAHLIKARRWTCGLKYASAVITQECSLSLLFVMCIDRFLAINFPFTYRQYANVNVTVLGIVVVYLVELIRGVVVYGILLDFDPSEPKLWVRCNHNAITPHFYNTYFMSIKQALQITISFCCCLQVIIVSLRQRRKISNQVRAHSNNPMPNELKRQMAEVKISSFLMILFMLLWTPTFLIPPVSKQLGTHTAEETLYILLTKIPRLINSAVNAFVYALSRPKYRNAYKFLITTLPWRWGQINIAMNRISQHHITVHVTPTSAQRTTMRRTTIRPSCIGQPSIDNDPAPLSQSQLTFQELSHEKSGVSQTMCAAGTALKGSATPCPSPCLPCRKTTPSPKGVVPEPWPEPDPEPLET